MTARRDHSLRGPLLKLYEPPTPEQYQRERNTSGVMVLIGAAIVGASGLAAAYDAPKWLVFVGLPLGVLLALAAVARLNELYYKYISPPKPIRIFHDGISIGTQSLLWIDTALIVFHLHEHREPPSESGRVAKKHFGIWTFIDKSGQVAMDFTIELPWFDWSHSKKTEYVDVDEFNNLLSSMGPPFKLEVGAFVDYFRVDQTKKMFLGTALKRRLKREARRQEKKESQSTTTPK